MRIGAAVAVERTARKAMESFIVVLLMI
jgi:hypothetical protein